MVRSAIRWPLTTYHGPLAGKTHGAVGLRVLQFITKQGALAGQDIQNIDSALFVSIIIFAFIWHTRIEFGTAYLCKLSRCAQRVKDDLFQWASHPHRQQKVVADLRKMIVVEIIVLRKITLQNCLVPGGKFQHGKVASQRPINGGVALREHAKCPAVIHFGYFVRFAAVQRVHA